MKLSNLGLRFAIAGFASTVLFVLPAMSGPISVFPKDLAKVVSSDDSPIVQVVYGRGGRVGVGRGVAVRGGYRGGAVVRRGAVATGGAYYAGGYCNPDYQYCGSAYYRRGAYYRGGGAYYRRGAYYRGGAVARGGIGRGARVAHFGGVRRR